MNQKEKKEVTPSKSKAFGFSFLVCMAEAVSCQCPIIV